MAMDPKYKNWDDVLYKSSSGGYKVKASAARRGVTIADATKTFGALPTKYKGKVSGYNPNLVNTDKALAKDLGVKAAPAPAKAAAPTNALAAPTVTANAANEVYTKVKADLLKQGLPEASADAVARGAVEKYRAAGGTGDVAPTNAMNTRSLQAVPANSGPTIIDPMFDPAQQKGPGIGSMRGSDPVPAGFVSNQGAGTFGSGSGGAAGAAPITRVGAPAPPPTPFDQLPTISQLGVIRDKLANISTEDQNSPIVADWKRKEAYLELSVLKERGASAAEMKQAEFKSMTAMLNDPAMANSPGRESLKNKWLGLMGEVNNDWALRTIAAVSAPGAMFNDLIGAMKQDSNPLVSGGAAVLGTIAPALVARNVISNIDAFDTFVNSGSGVKSGAENYGKDTTGYDGRTRTDYPYGIPDTYGATNPPTAPSPTGGGLTNDKTTINQDNAYSDTQTKDGLVGTKSPSGGDVYGGTYGKDPANPAPNPSGAPGAAPAAGAPAAGAPGTIDPTTGLIIGSGVVSAIAPIIAGNQMASAEERAAAAQSQASADALAEMKRQFDLQREDLQPWMTAGRGALAELASFDTLNPAFKFHAGAKDDPNNDPSYNFRFGEGLKALENSYAARGGLMSGNAMQGITNYGQQAASQEYNNAFNRYNTTRGNKLNQLQSLAGVGQSAVQQAGNAGQNYATNAGNAMMQGAQARAGGMTGAANANASGMMGAANSMTNSLSSWLNYNNQNNQAAMINAMFAGRK